MLRRLFSATVVILALVFVFFSKPENSLHTAGEEQHELHFWGIYDLEEVYQPIIDEFEKNNPDIEVVYRQFPNSEEYHDVLSKQLDRGKGPDIFLFPDHLREEVQAFINPTTAGIAEGFSPLVEEELVENRLVYGLPLWIDTLMLYYNKRYYADGVAHQWYEFAEQTRGINAGGIAMGRLDNIQTGWDMLRSLLLQKGVQLTGKPSNSVFDTMEFFTRFAYPIDDYFNWSEALNRNYQDAEVESFARERVAAIAGYSSLRDFLNVKHDQLEEQGLRRVEKEEVGVAPFPQFNPQNPKYLANYMALGVSIHSRLPNHAWQFIELLTNPQHAEYFMRATGRIPGRILETTEEDSELQGVQKHQARHSYLYPVSETIKEKISKVQARGVKDMSLLREVLDLEL